MARLFIVAAALAISFGIHQRAHGQAKLDGVYAAELEASGSCGFQRAEVSVMILGFAVTGSIADTKGKTQFFGRLDGNLFSIEATGESGGRLTIDGRVVADGSRIDLRAAAPQCTIQGELSRKH